MKTSVRNSVLEAVAKTIKGTSFVRINNYTSSANEISNQTLNVGYSLENALANDFKALQENKNEIFEELMKENFSFAIISQAYSELYLSLEKRLSSDAVKEALRLQNDATILRSDAQNDAYLYIAKGVKLHKETQKLHITGLVVKKEVLQKGEYKSVNSSMKTICKDKIKKLCNFREAKIRNFIFDKAEVKLQGIEIK